jgi:hypothetical protein
MEIAIYPPMPTRPCRFCLSLQGDDHRGLGRQHDIERLLRSGRARIASVVRERGLIG